MSRVSASDTGDPCGLKVTSPGMLFEKTRSAITTSLSSLQSGVVVTDRPLESLVTVVGQLASTNPENRVIRTKVEVRIAVRAPLRSVFLMCLSKPIARLLAECLPFSELSGAKFCNITL